MSKQIGRNPEAAKRVLDAGTAGDGGGFTGMVAVDFREARLLHSAGLPVKHLGHLCQVPRGAWDAALDMKPDVITLYSQEKAAELSCAAQKRGAVQDVLLRIRDDGDIFYKGQEGGFPLKTLNETLDMLEKHKGIRVIGLTSFPCFLYDENEKKPLPSPNTHTLTRGAELLRERGIKCTQINMPSCNSPATLPLAAKLGATHLEPGHSLTGTNPDNPGEADPLMPSLLYMSEVSHHFEGRSSCFGGGYYRRGNLRFALVKTPSGLEETEAFAPPLEVIDYHLQLSGIYPVGSPVCLAFRTQVFTTRSQVALVEGLSQSRPVLLGIWDSHGQFLSGSGG
jgi:predicted amino acid racemase